MGARDFGKMATHYQNHSERTLFWHERELAKFNASSAEKLEVENAALRKFFRGIELSPLPSIERLPNWCGLVSLAGEGPIQGDGDVDDLEWYFRGRFSHISLGICYRPMSAVDVEETTAHAYFAELKYGYDEFDASYMPEGEARYYILRELTNGLHHLGRADLITKTNG